jgi:hypothetical protein
MLLAAVQLGADNLEAFVNSPPWFWTVSGSSRWGIINRGLGEEQTGVCAAAMPMFQLPLSTADLQTRLCDKH